MPGQRAGTAVFAAFFLFTLSCDKGGSDLPLEPNYQEPQDASISGEVLIGEVGLPAVQVTLSGPETRTLATDAEGAFFFGDLKRGTYSLLLRGFDPARFYFPVTQETVTANDANEKRVQFVGSLVPQPPAAATGLQAQAGGPDRVELSWKDESDNESEFQVERREGGEGEWKKIGTTGADTASFSDTGLTPNTPYGYRVRACNEVGCSAYAEEARATTEEVPPVAPAELAAEADGAFAIRLTWSDRSQNEGRFEVERQALDGEGWGQVGTTGPDTASFREEGLTPNTSYVYRVRACNEVGCSEYTGVASATTDDVPPSAPSELTAEASSSTAIDLAWTDGSDNETGFEVERREGADGGWGSVGTNGADDTTFRDSGLGPVTTYTYRVRACNAMGCSDYTEEASATTPVAAPVPPSGLSAAATGPESIDLDWTDASDNETGFEVERRRTGAGSWSRIGSPGPDTGTFADSGLSPSTAYEYRVRACNEGGCSDYSNEAYATTESAGGPNLFISELYITQSTQTLGGDVPLVADKAGYLRVFVLADEANDFQPDVRVRFFLGGALAHTETIPAPGPSTPTAVFESSLGYSWNMPVPKSLIQPGLSILAEVDPENEIPEGDEGDNTFPASGSPGAMAVVSTPTFEVTFVPVRQSANGLVGNVTSGNAGGFLEDTRERLPIADTDRTVHGEYVTDAEVLESDNGNGAWGTILSEIYALRVTEGGSGHYYGVVKTSYTSGVAGMGYLGWPGAVGWDRLPSGSGVAAHEWGHNWNRAHAPGCGVGSPDPGYPYADGKIGVWGMDVGSEALKSPSTYYDFMSYCGPDWVSDYNYEAILDYRQGQGAWAASGMAEPSLLVWGRVEGDRIVLEPSFRVETRAALPAGRGEYLLEGLGPDGAPLFSMAFQPMPVPDGLPGEGHFAFAIPLGSFDEGRMAGLRVSGGGRTPGRMESPVGPDRVAPPAPEAGLRPLGGSTVEVTWDAVAFPMALVRDPGTGEILSFARGGSVRVQAPAGALELAFSDGIRSTAPVRRSVR